MRRARAILGARDMLWASRLLSLVRELGDGDQGRPRSLHWWKEHLLFSSKWAWL